MLSNLKVQMIKEFKKYLDEFSNENINILTECRSNVMFLNFNDLEINR